MSEIIWTKHRPFILIPKYLNSVLLSQEFWSEGESTSKFGLEGTSKILDRKGKVQIAISCLRKKVPSYKLYTPVIGLQVHLYFQTYELYLTCWSHYET